MGVAVAGSSPRAVEMTASLLDAGLAVTVASPAPVPYFDDAATRGLLTLRRRDLTARDIDLVTMVFAYTGDPVQNRLIRKLAQCRHRVCVIEPGEPETVAASHTGRVILVGGGPGDPGLLTVAGRDALAAAQVIVTDRLAPVGMLAAVAPHATVIDVSKIPGGPRTEQHVINDLLVERAAAGNTVVRFKGGDGFVFGRGGEELDHCVRAGIPVQVIPGVSSSIAAPAAAGIPVTHRGLTQGFTVVTGHVPPGHPESTIDYAALARTNTTLVLMMAVANLEAITAALIAGGMAADTPAAVIADGCLSSQREVRGTVGTIAAAAVNAEIRPPATTVIGPVAGFAPGQVNAPASTAASAAPTMGPTTGTHE
ncbi:uroporphyrinogen-III C-methyltransferase [Mycobacterium sp. smrl_JER01]|uniref:uroporphyrinogen-III C-methyltransferase n=1 Tax=Mycobacterium sp. smrl_JER01 TaxID=3402633 RepID=UPI003ACACFB1